MSLDTVLKIGKALRQTENSLRFYKYVQPCPVQKDKEGNSIYPLCLTIPVNEDFSFDWDKVTIIPENERDDLYYLNFSTSDSDSSPKKFGFGDISYTRKSEIDKAGKLKGTKDYGNFTFEKGDSKNAFLNGQNVFQEIRNEYLMKKINLLAIEIEDSNERQAFAKQLLKYYNENKPDLLPKTLKKFSDKIDPILFNLKIEDNKIELFNFQRVFNSELSKFNLLLLYAPAFEFILENKQENFLLFLQNAEELKKIFIKVNLEKNLSKVKKLFDKGEQIEDLSENANKAILKFADFSVFIHFDFKGKHWHEYKKSFSLIKDKLNSELTDTTEMGIVPSKTIYRTLCSGNDKNDIQFPFFDIEKRHKSFAFKNSFEFEDFLYTDSFVKQPLRRLHGTKIDLYIFPALTGNEEGITGKDYIEFFSKKDEVKFAAEPIFPAFLAEAHSKLRQFDFILSDSSGNTTNDLIEISGIDISNLRTTMKRIENIASEIYSERKLQFRTEKDLYQLSIELSFRNILGSLLPDKAGKITFKANPKYKSHLLKILPAIYTNSYHNDLILLSAFIQNVEYSIRAGDEKFSFLKFDLKFLLKIQNTQNDTFMKITNSESYQIGLMLGSLARNLSLEINSFEKNYVGNLTRRINNLPDFIKLKNEIEQKLIMHDKVKFTFQTSYDLAQDVKNFKSKYDKDECAFGFFENYFKPITKRQPVLGTNS